MAIDRRSLVKALVNRPPKELTLKWATVASVSPIVTVSMATGAPLALTANAAGPLQVGDRVLCSWRGTELIAISSPTAEERHGQGVANLTPRVQSLELRQQSGTHDGGKATTGSSADTFWIPFPRAFPRAPVVVTNINHAAGGSAVLTSRATGVGDTGFGLVYMSVNGTPLAGQFLISSWIAVLP